ncbi:signal peptidase I [Oceanobacillus neutriphilus]|uniref:Signal peptidase I n=1 Tax=Oceanobacillus neutriphilus TaxID=531815 RepID=A0ABQ2NZN4_9BACI|nr:signal peptidase I [Oceanobacillus neutriphilus]GGP14596.1 signal peptidase I S [Oceanobacillus neutriphilus]
MENINQKKEWIGWFKAIVITIMLALFLRTFIFATSIVEGESMYPTLQDGERVIFNKVVYSIHEPDRGDIVIIHQPPKNYVKRVIGMPGETIEIKNSQLYIDDEAYQQHFLSDEVIAQTNNFGPIEIPEDNYFVMGDNRLISKDSRNGLGFIPRDDIIGKSELIIYPFSEFGRVE